MKKFILVILSAVLSTACVVFGAEPKVIAHRGYWQAPGSAQNSIRALVKADSVGCYASEFDVWMTGDSVLVVNHDHDIEGIVIEKATYAELKNLRLPNGEAIPTLDEYLKAAVSLNVRLVCELKVHDSREHEAQAVAGILEAVARYGLESRTDYITFSATAFKDFCSKAPAECGVYYLNGDYIPSQIKFMGGQGIDYSMRTMRNHPEWIDEAHDLGLLVNIWTVDAEADMKWCIEHGADFITTDKPEELKALIANTKL